MHTNDPLAQNPLIHFMESPSATLRQRRADAHDQAQDRAAIAAERYGCDLPTDGKDCVTRKPGRPGTSVGDYMLLLLAPRIGDDRAKLFDACPVLMVSDGYAILDAAVVE